MKTKSSPEIAEKAQTIEDMEKLIDFSASRYFYIFAGAASLYFIAYLGLLVTVLLRSASHA